MGKANVLGHYLNGVCILFKDFEPMRGEDPAPTAEFVSYRLEDGKTIITRFCSLCEMNEDDVIEPGKDYVYIGECPHEEEPFRRYHSSNICKALIIQLRNTHGKEPNGARLYAKYERGQDGYSVFCEYDNEKPYSFAYALLMEDGLPEKWSPAAKHYLEASAE